MGTLHRFKSTLFACNVATHSVGALAGDFRRGGDEEVRTSRRTPFVLFLVVEGLPAEGLPGALFEDHRVFNKDLVSFPLVFFVFGPRFAFRRAPFRHLKHGLLQRFLESGHRLPQMQTQNSSSVWATGGVPSILAIRFWGLNWGFPRCSRELLLVWGVDTSAGAGATGVVSMGFLADVRGFFLFSEPRRVAS